MDRVVSWIVRISGSQGPVGIGDWQQGLRYVSIGKLGKDFLVRVCRQAIKSYRVAIFVLWFLRYRWVVYDGLGLFVEFRCFSSCIYLEDVALLWYME